MMQQSAVPQEFRLLTQRVITDSLSPLTHQSGVTPMTASVVDRDFLFLFDQHTFKALIREAELQNPYTWIV